MQLLGPNMYPFNPVKQHIFMSALFEPLQAVCNAVTADLTEVCILLNHTVCLLALLAGPLACVYVQINQSTLFNTSVNVTIAFTIVFGECILDKVHRPIL